MILEPADVGLLAPHLVIQFIAISTTSGVQSLCLPESLLDNLLRICQIRHGGSRRPFAEAFCAD